MNMIITSMPRSLFTVTNNMLNNSSIISSHSFSSFLLNPHRHTSELSSNLCFSSFICHKPNSGNSIYYNGYPLNSHLKVQSLDKRSFCVKCSNTMLDVTGFDGSSSNFKGSESFFRSVLGKMESVYLERNPTAKSVLELVHSAENDRICYDHFAFRTFGVNGHGIDSMADIFLNFGYTKKDELRFPAKKLKAYWFSPPSVSSEDGSGINGPLPRVFISELLVDQMSLEAQLAQIFVSKRRQIGRCIHLVYMEIIRKYTEMSGKGNQYAALAGALGSLTWEKPFYSEFQQLARESEYAAWTLVNGFALNHVTISTHRLKTHLRSINNLNQFIQDNGFKLNSEGGVLKVSPDGFLQQSSTVADSMPFHFADGVTETVPCSYIEFAERLVLPQFKNLPDEEVKECHRRDGFEVGNADKIFESTSKDQLTRRST